MTSWKFCLAIVEAVLVTLASSRLSRWHLADAYDLKNTNNKNGWQDAIQTAAKMAALLY